MIATYRYCPIHDETCPYFCKPDFCSLENPLEDCDSYAAYIYEEDEDEGH